MEVDKTLRESSIKTAIESKLAQLLWTITDDTMDEQSQNHILIRY